MLQHKQNDLYHDVSFDNVLRFLRFDIYENDVFVIADTIFRQKKGLAIGGTCLAPNASAYCMNQERKFYANVLPLILEGPYSLDPGRPVLPAPL